MNTCSEDNRNIKTGGFVYTNKDSVSVGVVTHLSALVGSGTSPYEILDEFKKHEEVASLVSMGEFGSIRPISFLRVAPGWQGSFSATESCYAEMRQVS